MILTFINGLGGVLDNHDFLTIWLTSGLQGQMFKEWTMTMVKLQIFRGPMLNAKSDYFLSHTYFNSDSPTATCYTSVTANYRRPNIKLVHEL